MFNDLSGIKTIDMAKTLVSKQSTCTMIFEKRQMPNNQFSDLSGD